MVEFVASTGIVAIAVALSLILKPRPAEGLLARVLTSSWQYGAALLILLLGAGLIAAAESAARPAAVAAAGWALALVSLVLVVLSRSAGRRLARWLRGLPAWWVRLLLLPPLLLGGVLLWAALA